jgi:endonuclease/exonuclease/phosphatase family metal-dependent hydrolase
VTSPLTILTWNLQHGGGPIRMPEIAIYLAQQSRSEAAPVDCIVLCEFRPTRSSQLAGVLADAGLMHSLIAPAPREGANTIAVFARWPVLPNDITRTHAPQGHPPGGRLLACSLQRETPVQLLGVHIPDESRPSARDACWDAALAWARASAQSCAVLAGDFNTSRTGIDPPRPGQTCEHCMGALTALGFTDAWRAMPESLKPVVSWRGPCGERQRLDMIFASASLTVTRAWYDSWPLEARLSDHAPLIACVGVAASHTRQASPEPAANAASTPSGLFSGGF